MTESRPLDYTTPEVLAESARARRGEPGCWADPEEDPSDVAGWDARRARALVPFTLDDSGRPVNPAETTAHLEGRNDLGRWGENAAADPVVTATLDGVRHLLMVCRKDRKQWAFPGGMIEPGETVTQAALRELEEETGLAAAPVLARPQKPRYVPDPRASRRAWITTGPVLVGLGDVGELPKVTGADDAERAAWIPAASVYRLAEALDRDHGGGIYPPHIAMLAEFLGEDR